MKQLNKTAGETAKHTTKPAWGFVAIIGFVMACTMAESVILAGIGVALFGFGAWKGGYMEDTLKELRNNFEGTSQPAAAGERRAA